jgi:hypothetical protein
MAMFQREITQQMHIAILFHLGKLDLCPSLQPTNPQESRSALKNEKKGVDE